MQYCRFMLNISQPYRGMSKKENLANISNHATLSVLTIYLESMMMRKVSHGLVPVETV